MNLRCAIDGIFEVIENLMNVSDDSDISESVNKTMNESMHIFMNMAKELNLDADQLRSFHNYVLFVIKQGICNYKSSIAEELLEYCSMLTDDKSHSPEDGLFL